MKQAYKSINFRSESLSRIVLINEIVRDYQRQGLRLTLRQLYYQLVSRNVVPNTEKSYKALGGLTSDARLAGLVDWDAIEDRNREPVQWSQYEDIGDFINSMEYGYRRDRWAGQRNYVELWVEKAALAGVLRPIASKFHATLMVNRGYSSTSAMYESARRFRQEGLGREKVLFYLGDHDPSGEDMVRDIADRMQMFGIFLEVRKLALTMEQVEEHRPPPNPAKMSDSRAAKYVAEHGSESWEVDALNPTQLRDIIEAAFREVVDVPKMNEAIAYEAKERKHLKAALPDLVEKIGLDVMADESGSDDVDLIEE